MRSACVCVRERRDLPFKSTFWGQTTLLFWEPPHPRWASPHKPWVKSVAVKSQPARCPPSRAVPHSSPRKAHLVPEKAEEHLFSLYLKVKAKVGTSWSSDQRPRYASMRGKYWRQYRRRPPYARRWHKSDDPRPWDARERRMAPRRPPW